MLTEEERLKRIYGRAKEIRQKEQRRRQRIVDTCCIAACVVLIFGLGMVLPQIAGRADDTGFNGISSGAASIFGSSTSVGYVFMGILCFLLGVFATLLLYRLHRRNKKEN